MSTSTQRMELRPLRGVREDFRFSIYLSAWGWIYSVFRRFLDYKVEFEGGVFLFSGDFVFLLQ